MIISGKSFHVRVSLRRIIHAFLNKLLIAVFRIVDIFRFLPSRLLRVAEHLSRGIRILNVDKVRPGSIGTALIGIAYWWMYFILQILDCLGVGEIYETICDLFKFNSRPLLAWEKELAKSIFGNKINYARVRIDEYALLGPRQLHFCYVSFFHINSWGTMQNSLLLHELTHVWQYQKLGIVYIPKALLAQKSATGYDYGGVDALKLAMRNKKKLVAFNLEQQAEIVADYYRIKNGYLPNWGNAGISDLPVYEHFIQQINNHSLPF